MLWRYRGPVVLRENEQPKAPVVPGNYFPRKLYPYRGYWTQAGIEPRPLRNPQVTLEQELAEIRARHAARREYNRVLRAARAALSRNKHVSADHRALVESDA